MRSRFQTWILLALFVVFTGVCLWKLGHWRKNSAEIASPARPPTAIARNSSKPLAVAHQSAPIRLLSQPGLLNSQPPTIEPQPVSSTNPPSRFSHRLSNTSQTVGQLARRDKAILLENALFDTASAIPAIPAELQSQGDPGTYIVQAKGPLDDAFRNLLRQAGATIVSYVPNNAYLVRASAS